MATAASTPTFDRYRVMWPLVPAMAMVMIDFTIVSISLTTIQADVGLTPAGAQWVVTAYALATAAFVALAGRLGDIFGHQRIVVAGVLLFSISSLLCGLTPEGDAAEAWLIGFRTLQGIGGALLIPSATVLVLQAFPTDERGKGLSLFFIMAGLFTALGPIVGSYLTEYWTWRSIFWINVPVALFALFEMRRITLRDERHPSKVDWPGAVLIVVGMTLLVLGLQQSTVWGWGSPATIGSIVAGLVVLALFVMEQLRSDSPLVDVRTLAAKREFVVDIVALFLFFMVWLAIFLFGSQYFQISVEQSAAEAGFSVLTVFYPFFATSRMGGVMMDKVGAKLPAAIGMAMTAAGLALWAYEATDLSDGSTLWGRLITGGGLGFVMAALNTDALNQIPQAVRGQASGVVQTVRNFGSALGVAILGTVLLTVQQDNIQAAIEKVGIPAGDAEAIAAKVLAAGAGEKPPGARGDLSGPVAQRIGDAFEHTFAEAVQAAFYAGAGIVAVGFLIVVLFMPGGRQKIED